ncbi:hypothetical protein [Marinicauda salina]|uniref:hypothetical protein n=1 Tax=Marinicauda salina TaxID=2135793 RepID=UPI0013048A97|nr:hypothetical protein [Marinicauda salina]
MLDRIAAAGLAVSTAVLSYAGFLHLFGQAGLAALVGAVVGGFVLGRMHRAARA